MLSQDDTGLFLIIGKKEGEGMKEPEQKKRLLFIYNPRAGKEKIRSNLLDIVDIFAKAGYEITVCPTQAKGDGERAVMERERNRFDLVVCCGGDGTLDEVVSGMMRSRDRLPVGYVPAGSTNDFASSLEIPHKMSSAARAIVEGKSFPCDVGCFNEDYFVYIAAFGLFTEVSYATRQDMKNVLGHMAYLLEGVKSLSNIKAYELTVESEELCVSGSFLYGMVTNSVSVGGFKNITGKNVKLDDGEFEVTLIRKPNNPLELNRIMVALVNRDISTESMYCFKTTAVTITSEDEIPWTLDGEFGGSHRRVEIRNEKQALSIIK